MTRNVTRHAHDMPRRTVEHMDLVSQRQDFDGISWNTRLQLSQKYVWLMEQLVPYVDGSMGEVTASMVQAWLTAARDMGRLWDVSKRPYEKPEVKGVAPEKVQALLREQEERFSRLLDAAVAEAVVRTEERLRLEVELRERLSLEQGRDAVLRVLGETRGRVVV